MQPIKILYVNGGPLNRGGIESYMMNYYRNFDRNKIQIDFVSIGMQKSVYDDEIESLGGKIYYVPKKSRNYLGYINSLRNIFKSGNYKIVHTHMDAMGMTVLKEAKKCKIPVRIAHSHNTKHLTNNFIKLKINEYARKNINKYATHMFACSDLAGKWLFGESVYNQGRVEIVRNAIDIDKFIYDKNKRYNLRFKYGISNDEIVIGHVGRFDYQKNHEFIVDFFAKLNSNKYKLILVGDGHLKEKIKMKIRDKAIKNNVIIIDSCDNVNELYNIFDIFILPSHFEGLGIVAIEAQVNGIPCIVSSNVPKEVKISEHIEFLSIENTEPWCKMVDKCIEKNKSRIIDSEFVTNRGYNIKFEAKKMQEKYILLYKENS